MIPAWLDPLFDAEEMRSADSWAIEEQKVPSIDLMERAGAGLARLTAEVTGHGPVRMQSACARRNSAAAGGLAFPS